MQEKESTTAPAAARAREGGWRGPLPFWLVVPLFYTLVLTLFFSPVIFSGGLLAPADGVLYYLPNFYSSPKFWDVLIQSGFPMAADPQVMMWYPPSRLFSLLPGGWNLFVLAAYISAASFTCGYVFAITRCRLAGLVGGLVYAMCGFLMAHLGHTTIIHSAAWLPLILWSFEELRRGVRARWLAIGGVALTCGALAGHTQVFFYTLCLTASYILLRGWQLSHDNGRRQYYISSVCLLVLGLGLAALQLLPTAELAAEGARAQLDFTEFVSYSLPVKQLSALLFPQLFGGSPGSFYAKPYFGAWGSGAEGGWGPTELTGYVGLLPPLLAAIGLRGAKDRPLAWFWAGVAALALLLALGPATPLAKISYHLPVFNKFRIPARHLLEMAFAVSVLSGLGVAAVREERVSRRFTVGMAAAFGGLMLTCLLLIILFAGKLKALAAQGGAGVLTLRPWANPAVGVPLLLLGASLTVLLVWRRRPRSAARSAALLAVILVDLASLGWFCEWHYTSPPAAFISAPEIARRYGETLDSSHQRLLPVRGGLGKRDEIPPNLSRLWEVPSASGYGPFISGRMSRLLSMAPHGAVDASWRQPLNQSLNLLSVRYVFAPPSALEAPELIEQEGIKWSVEDFDLTLGSGCGQPRPGTMSLPLPAPAAATAIGIVSTLACSTQLSDEAELVSLLLTDIEGRTHTRSLRAGRDSSEWAYDCPGVGQSRHRRARIFKSTPTIRESAPCPAHQYLALLPLDGIGPVRSLELRWVGTAGSISINKISLIDQRTGATFALAPALASLADGNRWRFVEKTAGGASVYENLRARPRAWLVSNVAQVTGEEVLMTIRSSRLPDGRVFDPSVTALVEEPVAFPPGEIEGGGGTAALTELSGRMVEVRTSSPSPAFLVLSDASYPGWRASIDGQPARIYQTDYVLRGLPVPPGEHVVRFEYHPRSFSYGVAISALSLLALFFWLYRSSKRAR